MKISICPHMPARCACLLLLVLSLPLALAACTREQTVTHVPTLPTASLGFDYAPETLEVWRVRPGSMASQADVQANVHVGDRLVAVEGLTLQRAGEEDRVLQGKRPGERVLVTVQRGSLQLTFPVVLQPRE